MEVYTKASWTKFMILVPSIKKNPDAWRVIEIILDDRTDKNLNADVTERVKKHFDKEEGAIFSCGEQGIMVMVNLGGPANLNELHTGLEKSLSGYGFKMKTYPATTEGMKKIEIRLSDLGRSEKDMTCEQRRKRRTEKHIFVVDDDMFMRSLIVASLKPFYKVTEFGDGNDLQEQYIEHAPDAVFLDIHMPGKTGQEILKEILGWDEDAFVIMVSADSAQPNVLEAKEMGAKWFLTKPVSKEKVLGSLKLNPSFAEAS